MNASLSQGRSEAFELTGTVASVTVLRLKTIDVAQIEAELRERIAVAPMRFLHAPVIIDVGELEADAVDLPLHDLADRLRGCKLVPIGAANLPQMALWNASASGLALVQLAGATAQPVDPARSEALGIAAPRVETAPGGTSVTVRQPVRSGQVVYAQNADLVVLAPVSSGAQVIADGHVHVYAPLRGHALAGAQGREDAGVLRARWRRSWFPSRGITRLRMPFRRSVGGEGRRSTLRMGRFGFSRCRGVQS